MSARRTLVVLALALGSTLVAPVVSASPYRLRASTMRRVRPLRSHADPRVRMMAHRHEAAQHAQQEVQKKSFLQRVVEHLSRSRRQRKSDQRRMASIRPRLSARANALSASGLGLPTASSILSPAAHRPLLNTAIMTSDMLSSPARAPHVLSRVAAAQRAERAADRRIAANRSLLRVPGGSSDGFLRRIGR
jgi:hypothetical protein